MTTTRRTCRAAFVGPAPRPFIYPRSDVCCAGHSRLLPAQLLLMQHLLACAARVLRQRSRFPVSSHSTARLETNSNLALRCVQNGQTRSGTVPPLAELKVSGPTENPLRTALRIAGRFMPSAVGAGVACCHATQIAVRPLAPASCFTPRMGC